MEASTFRGQIDVAIITIREDEFTAVLKHFPPAGSATGHRRYELGTVQAVGDHQYNFAAVRCPAQGEGTAQNVTRDLIEDLAPHWILLVGIGGAVPSLEFTLGDVVCASRVHDFCVSMATDRGHSTFQGAGGPMHTAVEDLLAALPAWSGSLADWTSAEVVGVPRPAVRVPAARARQLYGDAGWRKSVRNSLLHHFPSRAQRAVPIATAQPVASSDRLMKSPELLRQWQTMARNVAAVEMELGGVYMAARRREREFPVLAIRGISDIVGLERDEAWNRYACNVAAAFTRALVRSAVLARREPRPESVAPILGREGSAPVQIGLFAPRADDGERRADPRATAQRGLSSSQDSSVDMRATQDPLLGKVTRWYQSLAFTVQGADAPDGAIDLVAQKFVQGIGTLRLGIRVWRDALEDPPPEIFGQLASYLDRLPRSTSVTRGVIATTHPGRAESTELHSELITTVVLPAVTDQYPDLVELYARYVRVYQQRDIFQSYVPLDYRTEGRSERDVEARILRWIEAEPPGLFSVLAHFGAGKTTLLERIKYELAQRYLRGESTLKPFLLPLRNFYKTRTLPGLLESAFPSELGHDIPPAAFTQELERGGFVLLLDAFDEMEADADAEARRANMILLSQLFTSNSRTIITCRPEYFVSADEYNDAVKRRRSDALTGTNVIPAQQLPPRSPHALEQARALKGRRVSNLLDHLTQKFATGPLPRQLQESRYQSVQLEGFTEHQIDQYLARHDADFKRVLRRGAEWIKKNYLSRVYDLRDLMRLPIQLAMIVETLLSGEIDVVDANAALGVAELYEVYTHTQLKREEEKGRRLLSVEQRCMFAEAIALTMLERGKLEVAYDEILEVVNRASGVLAGVREKLRRATSEEVGADVRLTTFLKRDDAGQFRFAHKSYMEFFVARHLKESVVREALAIDHRFRGPLPREVLYFVGGFARANMRIWERLKSVFSAESAIPDAGPTLRSNIGGVLLCTGGHLPRFRLADCEIGVDLLRCTLDETSLQGVAVRGTRIQDVSMVNTSWDGTFEDVVVERWSAVAGRVALDMLGTNDLVECRWTGVNLLLQGRGWRIRTATLDNADAMLRGAATDVLDHATLTGGRLVLSGARMDACHVSAAELRLTSGAHLTGGVLESQTRLHVIDGTASGMRMTGGTLECTAREGYLEECVIDGADVVVAEAGENAHRRSDRIVTGARTQLLNCRILLKDEAAVFDACTWERCRIDGPAVELGENTRVLESSINVRRGTLIASRMVGARIVAETLSLQEVVVQSSTFHIEGSLAVDSGSLITGCELYVDTRARLRGGTYRDCLVVASPAVPGSDLPEGVVPPPRFAASEFVHCRVVGIAIDDVSSGAFDGCTGVVYRLLPRPEQPPRRRRSRPVFRRFQKADADEARLFVMTWQTGDVLDVDAVAAELAEHDLPQVIGTAFRTWLEQLQRLLEAADRAWEAAQRPGEPLASEEPPPAPAET